MTIDIIHFDTASSTYDARYNDPFNTTFKLIKPIKNASKIYLKSIEMPINFYNVRNVSTMNKLLIKTNTGTTYGFTISEGNYTTIAALLSAINSALLNVIPNTTISLTNVYGFIVMTAVSTSITSFTVQETILSKYFLGFNANTVYSGLTATAKTQASISVDNYMCMYITNVSAENSSNDGSLRCSFKIPLNALYGQFLYLAEQLSFSQPLLLLNSSHDITYLNVVIIDRFNNPILSQNNDYSFTLGIEYRETNCDL